MRALGALIELLTIMSDARVCVFAVSGNFMPTWMDLLELNGDELIRRLVFPRFYRGDHDLVSVAVTLVRRSLSSTSITDGSQIVICNFRLQGVSDPLRRRRLVGLSSFSFVFTFQVIFYFHSALHPLV